MTDVLLTGTTPSTETTFFGATIAGSVTIGAHTWTADSTGSFQTTTNLATEWQGYYDRMLAGDPTLTNIVQRLEANAQAVFLNTGLAKLDAATQQRDREDVQREFDAMSSALQKDGISGNAPLTTAQYLQVEQTIQSDPTLQELAIQGHGLNSPSEPKYNGYTNDFQNGVDSTTLYVGGGLDNNQNALTDFMDDAVLSHVPFPTVMQNGTLEQLNQNGNAEDTLANAVGALDQIAFVKVLKATDFSTTAGTASSTPAAPPASPATVLSTGQMLSLTGQVIPTTITLNGHVWTANSSGLYVTTTNLAAEWQGYYKQMLAGNGASLTATQFLEGNAEAVFENTGLAALATSNATQLAYDRMDVQREIDAIVGAEAAAGINANAPITEASYLLLEHTMQDNATLEELAVQGHGLNSPPSAKYNGYTNDFQNNVDNHTLYVGVGNDSGERAIADLFDDSIMTHIPFPTVAQSGQLEQLNQNGAAESTVQKAVDEFNQFRSGQVLKATDFNVPGNAPAGSEPAAGTTTTVFGATIASTMTANGDVWTIGSDGVFHTTTDLQTEWEGYYQTMLAGKGASLTAIQRLEGNAEAVFDNTGLSNLKTYNAAKQQAFREDAAREFDAIAVAMQKLGLGSQELTAQNYLAIGQLIQSDAALEELAIQGHGLNSAPSTKYYGYTTGFQNNSDNTTYFVGGGLDSGQKAIANFFDDVILTHLPFPVVYQNSGLEQLNQNGNSEDTLATSVGAMNEAMFQRVFVAGDFSTNANATGPVVYVNSAAATLTPPASPTAGAGQMLSLTGVPISTTLVVNGDTWTANPANGLYATTTDLTLAWYNAYQAAQQGQTLTLTQKWEAQAEAVFLNTGLAQVSEGQQAQDRMDAQMEIDAVVTIMGQLGLGSAPLTDANYLAIEHALQDNAALEQLAVEGHGLNTAWTNTEYLGYTNNFQYAVDNRALYVGPGPDNGERALADFFDDAIMTHLPFPTIMQNGEVTQLNQNGNAESTLNAAVQNMNNTLFGKLLTAANFMTPGYQAPVASVTTPPATITGFYGDTLAGTITVNGHVWTADANGTYQTTTNLEMEWRTYYQMMLNGQGGQLTATQRMEANAEAFFENTSINTYWNGAASEEADRVAVQREIDAIAGAMALDQSLYGISTTAPFTVASYLQLGTTLQGNAQLEELALQGHGLSQPPSVRYAGFYNLVMTVADWQTAFVGGGVDNGKLADNSVFGDIISNLPFATAFYNGAWMQTDAAGNLSETVAQAATMLNQTMFSQVYTASDFSKVATTVGAVQYIPNGLKTDTAAALSTITALKGDIVTLTGQQIAATETVNGHVWTADANGVFHTTSLAAEWLNDYVAVLTGNDANLTAAQRMEANAEAVLQEAGLLKLSATQQQADREDIQKQIDAIAAGMQLDQSKLGIPASASFSQTTYMTLQRTIRGSAVLAELSAQGQGVYNAGSRYAGFLYDATQGLKGTYIGGGVDNNDSVAIFTEQVLMTDVAFGMVWRGGKLVEMDSNGFTGLTAANAVTALNTTQHTNIGAAAIK